jgi:hypothetical protein
MASKAVNFTAPVLVFNLPETSSLLLVANREICPQPDFRSPPVFPPGTLSILRI